MRVSENIRLFTHPFHCRNSQAGVGQKKKKSENYTHIALSRCNFRCNEEKVFEKRIQIFKLQINPQNKVTILVTEFVLNSLKIQIGIALPSGAKRLCCVSRDRKNVAVFIHRIFCRIFLHIFFLISTLLKVKKNFLLKPLKRLEEIDVAENSICNYPLLPLQFNLHFLGNIQEASELNKKIWTFFNAQKFQNQTLLLLKAFEYDFRAEKRKKVVTLSIMFSFLKQMCVLTRRPKNKRVFLKESLAIQIARDQMIPFASWGGDYLKISFQNCFLNPYLNDIMTNICN